MYIFSAEEREEAMETDDKTEEDAGAKQVIVHVASYETQ